MREIYDAIGRAGLETNGSSTRDDARRDRELTAARELAGLLDAPVEATA